MISNICRVLLYYTLEIVVIICACSIPLYIKHPPSFQKMCPSLQVTRHSVYILLKCFPATVVLKSELQLYLLLLFTDFIHQLQPRIYPNEYYLRSWSTNDTPRDLFTQVLRLTLFQQFMNEFPTIRTGQRIPYLICRLRQPERRISRFY